MPKGVPPAQQLCILVDKGLLPFVHKWSWKAENLAGSGACTAPHRGSLAEACLSAVQIGVRGMKRGSQGIL